MAMAIIITPRIAKKKKSSSSQSKDQAKVVSLKPSRDVYKLITQQYNIRKASYEELCEMSSMLYEYGEISGSDHAILIFNPEIAPPEFIKLKDPNYSYFLTTTDQDGRRDWLLEFEARIKKNYATGNPHGAAYRERLLDILRRLERE